MMQSTEILIKDDGRGGQNHTNFNKGANQPTQIQSNETINT